MVYRKAIPIKSNWVSRCVEIYNFHVSQLKDESHWTIDKTAKALGRSIGSVSQDLTLASWLKTHEKQLRRFKNAKDALEYVKSKKREMNTTELDTKDA